MREAFVDHPDDDLDLPAVVRRKAPARPTQKRAAKPPRKPGIGERAASFMVAHPRQILAALFLTGCGGMIAWNALALQSSRHPAPLFTTREVVLAPGPDIEPEVSRPEVSRPEVSRPLPPARPGSRPADEAAQAAAPHEAAAHPVAEAAPAAAPKPRNPIAEMIRTGGQPAAAAPPPARAPQASAPAAPVAAAPAPAGPVR
ncbi:hypothetical protein, partial [Microvirga yunnanensis]|uniref:hypothetical protein n=1 Tax=Microvirga yunnanensis TaxID=2953740 RepID=UPI0021C6ACC0